MIEKISRAILNTITDEKDSEEQKEILLFGITRIVEDIPKYIGIIIICMFLGVIKELGVVFAINVVYKTFVGGVHMKTNWGCFFMTLLSFLICIYIPRILVASNINIYYIYGILYMFAVYVICVYVPADVPEIPIINEKRRKRDRIMAFIMLNIIYISAIFIMSNEIYSIMLIISVTMINLMTTRTMYKLFKNEYGYETYVPDELVL